MKLLQGFLLVVGSILTVSQGYAQDILEPYYRHITVDEGLPSSQVFDLQIDVDGYLWIGTASGVVRYDGKEIKSFPSKDNRGDNPIFNTYLRENGMHYFTVFGQGVFMLQDDSLVATTFNPDLVEIVGANAIPYELVSLTDSSSILTFQSQSPIIIDDKNHLEQMDLENDYKLIIQKTENSAVSYRYTIEHKDPWASANKDSTLDFVFQFDSAQYTYRYKFGSRQAYRSVCLLDDGSLVIAKGHKLVTCSPEGKIKDYHTKNEVVWLGQDPKGKLWLGCQNAGAECWGTIESGFTKRQSFLSSMTVSSVAFDHAGGYWFSTLEDGVYYSSNLEFNVLTTSGSQSNAFRTVDCNDEYLFAGNKKGNIYRIDRDFKVDNFDAPEADFGRILSVLVHDSALYISATGSSLHIKNTHVNEQAQLIGPSYYARRFIFDDYANLIRAHDEGFMVSDGQGKDVKLFPFDKKLRIMALAHSEHFGYLFGSLSGLYRYKDDQFEPFPLANEIIHASVNALALTGDNKLFVGTDHGLLCIDENYQINAIAEVPWNISSIFIDSDSLIWLGSKNGIIRLDIAQNRFKPTRISRLNGLLSDEVHDICVFNDMVFAATQRGVVQFNHNFKPMPVCVELLVTAINIDDAPFNLDSKIQLKPNIKSLDIQFTDLCYAAKGTSQYYYRLTKNEPWILTRDPIISLRSLKPGQYSLDIITSQGLEFGLDPLSIPVAVMPYWWQQIWVWILGFLILALVAYLLYRQQARSAKMNEDLLRYQLTSLNAQMNPHFIFNFLNSIQSFIYKNERTQATAYLSEFAELMRKMLDQTKVEQITLQEEISTVSLMASLEQKRFENPFEFEVIVSPEIAPLDLKIPSMLIQPHLENAIWHGIRHIKTKGSIVILIECGKENEIVISIKDNGVGIKASKPVEHKSSGLELTRSRHELICKKNGVKPRFEISDNPTGNDCPGTQVQFNLPTN